MRSAFFRRFAVGCLALALSGAAAQAQQTIGSAAAISNQVDGIVAGAASPLTLGSPVYLNELVRTGIDGQARLVFLDNTNLSVGPRSAVTLDRFVYNPGRSAGSVVVRASQGVFRFVTGSQRPQNYKIVTPVATIGVRGTVFDLYVGPDRIVVTLIEGQIVVTARQGRSVSLTQPGESITVYATGTVVRRADWRGTRPDFAALFGWVPVTAARSDVAEPFRLGRMAFGITFGGGVITSLPTASSSGFYTGGNLDTAAWGFLTGVEGFVDVARFGPSGAFPATMLSLGLMADVVSGATIRWSGLCGGVPCLGSGSLNELNVLAAAKLSTPLSATDTASLFAGLGVAALWPKGTPTGIGGPSFVGSAIAPAARIGIELDHRLSEAWAVGFKSALQFTGSTDYDTTLAGERFRIDHKTEMLFGVTLIYISP